MKIRVKKDIRPLEDLDIMTTDIDTVAYGGPGEEKSEIEFNEESTLPVAAVKERAIDDSAETIIRAFLETKEKTLTHLKMKEALSGAIDLHFIEELGYRKINSIVFQEGHITEIINLPKSVKILECPSNLLSTFKIPSNLETLNVLGNRLRTITYDASEKSSSLKQLNLGNNLFECLDITPQLKHFTNLESLNIAQTDITKIDLQPLESLKILYCSNHVSILNVREGIVFNPEDASPVSEVMNRLSQYFEYKNVQAVKLQKKLREIGEKNHPKSAKKAKSQEHIATKQSCFACKGLGKGAIFQRKIVSNDNKISILYTASCGALFTKCNLNLEIQCGNCIDKYEHLNQAKIELQNTAQAVIQEALQSKYEFVMPDETTARIKSIKIPHSMLSLKEKEEKYNEANEMYRQMLHPVDSVTLLKQTEKTNALKDELQSKLSEYKDKTKNSIVIQEARYLQRELTLEYKSLREMEYPYIDVDSIYDTAGNVKASLLIKSKYSPDEQSITVESMKLVHWVIT